MNIKVSFYNSCRAKKQERVSLFGLFSRIKHGDYKDLIDELRASRTKEKQSIIKSSKIPAFTFSVNCNGNHSKEHINDYFGIIGLDYDNVTDPVELKQKVVAVDSTLAAFISPRGNGLKVFVKTNSIIKDHTKAFNLVDAFYKDITGIESDQSVKDPTRLCLVSYDSEMFINENSKVFDVNEAVSLNATNSFNLEYVFNSTMLGFYEGSRHNVLISCAGKANRLGIDKDEVINYFKSYTDSTFNLGEVISSVEDIYNRYSHQFGTTTTPAVIFSNDDWLNYEFKSNTKNQVVLDKLTKDIVLHEYTGNVFRISDGVIDFKTQLNNSDFIMRLEDCGLKKSEASLKRILQSDRIKKINPFNVFLERLQGNSWDGIDRIGTLVKAANLLGDIEENIDFFTRWLCTAYSYAMRGIDNDIHYNPYSRVVLILYSQQRGVGKTTFFQKLGMSGEIKKKTGVEGLDIYTDFSGSIANEQRELSLIMESKMIIQLDDIDNALIKDSGTLRSIISKNSSDGRVLYSDHIKSREWRGVLCGSTNHRELVRNKDENRYLIFESNGVMDFDLLNSIDFIQLWSQIRFMCLKDKELLVFDTDYLEKVRQFSHPYLYNSIEDELIGEHLEFDENAGIPFSIIDKFLSNKNIVMTTNKLGSALKKLAPNGTDIKKTIKGQARYKVKFKSQDSNDNDLPPMIDF